MEIQILAINDFHGHLQAPDESYSYVDVNGTTRREQLGGAAQLGAVLAQLREALSALSSLSADRW